MIARILRQQVPTLRTAIRRPKHQTFSSTAHRQPTSDLNPSTFMIAAASLAVIGAGGFAYWKYITHSNYPLDVKQHLRQALYHHKHAPQDMKNLAEIHYLQALDSAEKANVPPHSKEFLGIMVELAQLYEDLSRFEAAAKTFSDAWRGYLAGGHYIEAVGAAHRTGRAFEAAGDLTHAEAAYAWSVKACLGLVESHPEDDDTSRSGSSTQPQRNDATEVPISQPITQSPLKPQLADWATSTDLSTSLDLLANLYAATSRPQLAIALYTRIMTIIDTSEKCKRAVLQNNLAESYVAIGRIDDAVRFAENAIKDASKAGKECVECLAVATFNLGAILEMKGDIAKARKLYQQARDLNVPSTTSQIEESLSRSTST
ncbi:hypothetical protein SmJEL517_g05652 [Synchytrium microbalum]|uniref:Uncharacterized protein n=1 Tax=Synchytrium microbalum TaxID=1806994 RepID=A0A507BUI9_9FUNG|nr:uncharacterized protein SmJEL517_g05652 [Synchytrium microbalum]TPX30881.1 hypothetical protein SmJEL517_g05652 [Synchytrium microbalum]